jgi:Protein of unknown function (DUF3429)
VNPGLREDVAQRLGYAGLIPFVAGAALVWFGDANAQQKAALALAAYAAVIVSFLGGIHWGVGFRDGRSVSFIWGVLPSLAAWVALLMPVDAALVLSGAMLVACYAVDRRLYRDYGFPPWLTLRSRLSGIAALSCFLGAAGL